MSDTALNRNDLLSGLSVPEWLSPAEQERTHLEVAPDAPQRRARPRALYALIAVAVLFGIVIAQLLASIAVSNNAFELQSLAAKQKALGRSYQVASEAAQKVESPQYLAANATALGMVPGSRSGFLQLSTGQVLGAPPQTGTAASSPNLIANQQLQGLPLVATQPGATGAAATAAGTAPATAAGATGAAAGATGAATGTPTAGATPTTGAPTAGATPTTGTTTAGSQPSPTPATPATPAAPSPVVLDGALPSPQTH